MYVSSECHCGGKCEPCASGLGFPIVPIVIGAASVLGSVFGKKGSKITEADAKQAVRQLFLEILEREPDYPANQPRVDCLLRREDKSLGQDRFGPGTCNVDDLRTELLQSEEYRNLQTKKAEAVYGPSAGVLSPLSGSSSPLSSLASGTVGGIPFTWIAVGLGLVLLMKR